MTLAAAQRDSLELLLSSRTARFLVDQFIDEDELRAIVGDPESAGLDEADVAAMELAEKVVGDATGVTADEISIAFGSSVCEDAEILDLVAAAAVRCFFKQRRLEGSLSASFRTPFSPSCRPSCATLWPWAVGSASA